MKSKKGTMSFTISITMRRSSLVLLKREKTVKAFTLCTRHSRVKREARSEGVSKPKYITGRKKRVSRARSQSKRFQKSRQ